MDQMLLHNYFSTDKTFYIINIMYYEYINWDHLKYYVINFKKVASFINVVID